MAAANKGLFFKDFMKLPEGKRSEYKLLQGHMPFGLHEYCPGGAEYFTILRDPLRCAISTYYHYINKEHHPLHDYAQRTTINDFLLTYHIDDAPLRYRFLVDFDLKPPDSYGQLELDKIKALLRNHFRFIGLMERFEESLVLLKHLFSWQIPAYKSANVGRYNRKSVRIDSSVIKQFHENNWIEYEIYKDATNQFDQLWNAKKELYVSELKQLKSKTM